MTTLLSPLDVKQDDELTAYLVDALGRLVLLTAILGLPLIFLTALPSLWGIYLVLLFGLMILGGWVLVLNRRGQTRLASVMLVVPVWVVITTTSTLSGGVQSGGYIGYVGIAIMAGLLLGIRAGTVFVVLSIAVGLWMAVGVENDWLPPVTTQSPVAAWLISTLLLVVIAFLQYVGSRAILRVMKRAQSSEADYRTLFEEAPDGICLIGADSRVALVNPALCQMLGYAAENLIGQDPATFVADEDRAARPLRTLAELSVPGSLKRERVLVREDGSRLDAIITSRFMPDGRFQYIVEDVTDRKQAEAALRNSEARFRTLVENLPDVVTRHDRELRYLYVSPVISSLSGYPPEDFLGKTDREMGLPSGLVEATERALDIVVGMGETTEFEFNFEIDNQTINYEARAVPEFAEDGSVQSVLTVNRNITNRRLAEAALRESENRYRSLLENIPAITYINDIGPGNHTLYISPQAEQLLGYPQDDFVAVPGFWIKLIHPDDRERVLAENVRTEATHEPFQIDYRLIARDGRVIWVRDEAVYVRGEGGQSDYWLGVWSKITERKRAEEREQAMTRSLRAVVEVTDELIASPDLDTFYHRAVELAREKLNVERCAIFLLDPTHEHLLGTYGTDLEGQTTDEHHYKLLSSTQPEIFSPGAQRWVIGERIHTYWDEHEERESVVGKGWVGITVIRSGGELIGTFANDAAISGSGYNDVTAETIAVYCSLLGSIIVRKRTEEALRRSENLFRRAIEAAGAAPYYMDYEAENYTFLSDKLSEITGYPLEEITPTLMGTLEQEYQMLGEAAGLTKSEAVARTRSGQIKIWQSDSRILTRTGQLRWVFDTSVQILNDHGRAIGAIGILQDITERKLVEEQLRQSHELYRRAIEAAGAVPYAREHPSSFTFVGESILQLTGFGPGEFTPDVLDSLIIESQMVGQCAPYSPEEATRLVRNGTIPVWQCDYRIRTRDGRTRWITDASIELVPPDGLSPGSIGILQDITDRKEAIDQVERLNAELELRVAQRTEALRASEARFRAMNDASPLGVYVDDPNGNCLYSNPIYQSITGLTAEQVLGAGWKKAIHLADLDIVTAAWTHAIERTPFVYEQVYRLLWPAGRVVWVSAKASVMRDGDQLLGYVGTLEDITARVESEESLRRRTAQLEAANRELEAFSYSVSHDLRAPLRAVDGFARLLLQQYDAKLDADGMRYLNKVRDSAQHMGHLIDDLLAFSRLGRHALKRQLLTSTDLRTLSQRVVDDVLSEIPERQIEVTIGALPACEADLNLLTQVFVNLVSNAAKFTRPREVAHIEIGNEETTSGPAYYVRDNGVGFDMQYHDKMFGVFQRLHRMEEFEGTGVGLAIVQRIIHRHGGRVWAESAPERGATFYFSIGRSPVEDV